MDNLDMLAAGAAQRILEATAQRKSADVDNLATKALGVLQENGVYAAALFLLSRSDREKQIADAILHELRGLLPSLRPGCGVPAGEPNKQLQSIAAMAGDLDGLLLVKQVWEQALTYARYGAKARGG